MRTEIESWVQQRAEQCQEQDRLRNLEHEWELHAHRIVQAQSPYLFGSLSSLIEKVVSRFNVFFPQNGRRRIEFQKIPSNRFLVRRPTYPALSLDVRLDLDCRCIRFTTATRLDHETPAQETEGRFRILVSGHSELQLADGERLVSLEYACKLLLEAFLAA